VKYTIAMSPEFLQDLPGAAAFHMTLNDGKPHCKVSVDKEDGTTIDVPVKLRVDLTGCIYADFEL